jgi:hypothetical protein
LAGCLANLEMNKKGIFMTDKSENPQSTKITTQQPDSKNVIKEKIGDSIELLIEGLPKATVSRDIGFSSDYIDLLKSIEQETNLDELTIIKQGLVFVALAMRIKKQGHNLAIVDNEGNVIANVSGY